MELIKYLWYKIEAFFLISNNLVFFLKLIMDELIKSLKSAYFRFQLQTGQYMLEPWEKILFNICFLFVAGLFIYSFTTYLSSHISSSTSSHKFF